jgi:hypothetical protein
VDAGSGFIRFAFGEDGYLDLTYGRTMFDGCGADSAVPVRIGKQPGLVNDFFEWAYVIWPATPAHPEGRYGVAASLDVDAVLALARSMEGALARLRMVEHNC